MRKILSLMLVASLVMSGLIVGQLLITDPVSAPGPDLPDLKISQENITLSTTNPIAGIPVIINATIWNVGNADAENVDVSFYEEDILIESKTIDLPVNATWTYYTIDSIGDVGILSSITIDDSSGVHISYSDNTNNDLKYAYKPIGGSWTIHTVESAGDVGYEPSITVDSANGIHICYPDLTNNYLKYAYKPSGGNWTFDIVDSSGGVSPSITLDNINGIHISYRYHDGINYVLKYAYKQNEGSWTNYIVDSTGDVYNPSIALDNTNDVHISYHDYLNHDLKYAYKPNGSNWTNYSVDTLGNVGFHSSIAVDSVNGVHIGYSFEEAPNRDLKYAFKPSGGNWTNFTIDSFGHQGIFCSLTIDGENGIHISYYDETDRDLKYAYKSGGENWSISKVDTLGDVGIGTSVTVDNTNGVHISYHDYGNLNLKYANLIKPPRNKQTSISWTPIIAGIRNITVKIDENNETEELDETNNEATISIQINDTDSDFDSLTNAHEFSIGTDPFNDDTDGDNLGDGFETIFSKTDPNDWDTNGNNIGDGLEFVANQGYIGGMQSLPDDWIGMTITWQNYTIYIKTNSSVLEGEFDKEDRKLKIKVSGPEGTQGTTEVDVPKSLCDPEDIEIKLDGELINYTMTQNKTYYNVHIEYNHSTHEITASFGYIDQTPDPQIVEKKGEIDNSFQIAFIIALITAILLLILLIKTRNGKQGIEIQELPPEKLMILLEKKYEEGDMTDETYKDIKSTLEKYNGDKENI